MEFQMFLLVLALMSKMIATHGEESPTDAYWKMNLGDDVKMPKVVEDALLGTLSNTNDKTSHATKVYNDIDVQAYAQQLLRTKSKAQITNGYNKNAAQVYAQQRSESETDLAVKGYHNAAQAYAQQLSRTKSNAEIKTGYDNNAPQVNVEQLSATRTDLVAKVYDDAAQAYAQQLSKTKSNVRIKTGYNNNSPQAYAQQLNEARTNLAAKVYDAAAAQAYAQQLPQTKSNAEIKTGYNNNALQGYAQQLSRTGTNPAVKVYHNSAEAYAQQLSRTKSNAATKVYDTEGSKLLTDNSVIFFLEKDLVQPGTKMKLHFLVGAQEAKFMPKKLANTIPFSSTKLPQILNYFNVDPKSANAKIIEETLRLCESKPIKGESKSCETSLESMIAYVKSHLGNQIKAFSTEISKETKEEYSIHSAQKIKNEENMVCHKLVYPYAVFSCHTLSKTDAYQVSLIDTHGKTVKAVAVCHKDTSVWNPGHVAFQLLNVKPGGVPICHFVDGDAMIWIPK